MSQNACSNGILSEQSNINIPKIQYLFLPVLKPEPLRHQPPSLLLPGYYEDTKHFLSFIVSSRNCVLLVLPVKDCKACDRWIRRDLYRVISVVTRNFGFAALESQPKERSIFKNGIMHEKFFVLSNQRLSLFETVIYKFSFDSIRTYIYIHHFYQITNAHQTVR